MDKAMNLIPAPEWSEKQIGEYFERTVKLALGYGLTTIHDADTNHRFVKFYKRCDFDLVDSLLTLSHQACRIAQEGTLPLRMYLMGYSPTGYWGNDTDKFPKLHNYGKHGRLNLRAVKLFTDGESFLSLEVRLGVEPFPIISSHQAAALPMLFSTDIHPL